MKYLSKVALALTTCLAMTSSQAVHANVLSPIEKQEPLMVSAFGSDSSLYIGLLDVTQAGDETCTLQSAIFRTVGSGTDLLSAPITVSLAVGGSFNIAYQSVEAYGVYVTCQNDVTMSVDIHNGTSDEHYRVPPASYN